MAFCLRERCKSARFLFDKRKKVYYNKIMLKRNSNNLIAYAYFYPYRSDRIILA